MEKSELMIIDDDDLEFDDDLRCLNDVPYTGIARETFPNGVIKSETIYKDGFQFGLSQEWYPSGQLKWEFYWKKGERFSESKAWHPNGKLKSLKKIEWGIRISYDEWDENGNLVKTDRIDSRPGDYSLLERFRQISIEKRSDSE